MPEKIKKSLMAQAANKGLKGERKNRYVYGTMAKMEKQRKKS